MNKVRSIHFKHLHHERAHMLYVSIVIIITSIITTTTIIIIIIIIIVTTATTAMSQVRYNWKEPPDQQITYS